MPQLDRQFLTSMLESVEAQEREAVLNVHRAQGAALALRRLLERLSEPEAGETPPPLPRAD